MYCAFQDREELEDDLYQEDDGDSEGSEAGSEVEFRLYSQLHYSSNAGEMEDRGEVVAGEDSQQPEAPEMALDADGEPEHIGDDGLPSLNMSMLQQHLKEVKEKRDKQKKGKSGPKSQGRPSSLLEEVIVIDSGPDVISISEDDTADDEGVCATKSRGSHQPQTSTPAQQADQNRKRNLSVPVTVDSSSSESESEGSASDSSDSSDSEYLENWMILGRGTGENEDQSISLNLEGGSDGSHTDAEGEGGSWSVSDRDKEAQIYNRDKGSKITIQRVPNRYYTNKSVQCRNCDKMGHLSKNCPEPKKLSSCFLCGTPGHMSVECPNKHCNNCGLPGHLYGSCSERPYWHKQCHRCSMKGHFFDTCPEIWRQYHLSTKAGPPLKQQGEDKGRSPAYCYNCSRRGHFGHACARQRMFNGVFASIPLINHYDTLEDINRRQHRTKLKVKDLKKNGCFSNTLQTPVTPGPPKKKPKVGHHENNHTPRHTPGNHKPNSSHIFFGEEDFGDTTPKTNKSKYQPPQSTSNGKRWKAKRPVPTSRDPLPSKKIILNEADDFPRGRGKGGDAAQKKSGGKKVKKTKEWGQREGRPDRLCWDVAGGRKQRAESRQEIGANGKKKRNRGRRIAGSKHHGEPMYPTDENLFSIKQRKRRR